MRLFLSVLALSLLSTCFTQEDGYVAMAPEDYENNTLITSLRDTGIAFVLQRALELGRIANTNFTLNNTIHVWNRTTETVWSYDFNVTVMNAQSDALNTGFIMNYFPGNETNTTGGYLFSLAYGPASATRDPDSAYVPVPPEEYETPLIQRLANFGKDHIANILINDSRIAAGTYNVIRFNEVLRQPLATGGLYQFDLNFAQEDGSNEVHGEFRVRYVAATDNITVTAYRHAIVGAAAAAGVVDPTAPVAPTGEDAAVPAGEDAAVPAGEDAAAAPAGEDVAATTDAATPAPVTDEAVAPGADEIAATDVAATGDEVVTAA